LELLILRFDSLLSTNTEAANQALQGAAEGLCVVAREQTKGRGREGRAWSSLRDAGLYFSMVLRPRFSLSGWPMITLMAAVAVHRALQDAFNLQADIKWPNDIYANEKKLCGILAETVETNWGRAVILGIGINLDDRNLPSELKETATSLRALLGEKPDVEPLLSALTQKMVLGYSILNSKDGIADTLRDWIARSTYSEGKRVRVDLTNESFEGITRGLEPDGALRVETAAGNIRIVRAGDVIALRAFNQREK
jgi:BirA family biotin operon repressor/biotin-[acetyl-CoA-carboxylase] ligase